MTDQQNREKELRDILELKGIIDKLSDSKKMQVFGYAQGLAAALELAKVPKAG